jgi:hypothetical protein
MGKAVPAAAVDLSPDALKNAQQFLGLPADRCYTDMGNLLPYGYTDQLVEQPVAYGLLETPRLLTT